MQTMYACGGGGSQQREVADGPDVVFTDTDKLQRIWWSAMCFYVLYYSRHVSCTLVFFYFVNGFM